MSCGEFCVESSVRRVRLSFLYTESLVVYIGLANPCWACGGGSVALHWVPLLCTYWRRNQTEHSCWVIVAAAQQILAELVEGGLSRLVLSRVNQTRHHISAESSSCPVGQAQEQLCQSISHQRCGTQCCLCWVQELYIIYSPVDLPTEPDSASESIVFGTVLDCKGCLRYGFLREIQLQAACNSIAQSTELSIHNTPIRLA